MVTNLLMARFVTQSRWRVTVDERQSHVMVSYMFLSQNECQRQVLMNLLLLLTRCPTGCRRRVVACGCYDHVVQLLELKGCEDECRRHMVADRCEGQILKPYLLLSLFSRLFHSVMHSSPLVASC